VFGQSLIRFEPVPFDKVPSSDWIFFSSRNSVQFFFDGKPSFVAGTKFGVIGSATDQALSRHNVTADFVGQGGDTRNIAQQFASLAGSQNVLFPISAQSLRTVQQALSGAQVQDLVCYRTYEDVSMNSDVQADVFIFTSPSNVRSFFRQNLVLTGAGFVAIGEATATELASYTAEKIHRPWAPNELALADAVLSI